MALACHLIESQWSAPDPADRLSCRSLDPDQSLRPAGPAHRVGLSLTATAAPVALALGMSGSFVVLGVGVALLGPAWGSRRTGWRQVLRWSWWAGLVMVVPRLGAVFTRATWAWPPADASVDAAQAGDPEVSAEDLVFAGVRWAAGPTMFRKLCIDTCAGLKSNWRSRRLDAGGIPGGRARAEPGAQMM